MNSTLDRRHKQGLLLLNFLEFLVPVSESTSSSSTDSNDWFGNAQNSLHEALHNKHNTNVAKNVIIFVADGMGITTQWAARIYAGQYKHDMKGEEYEFEFEKFPHLGLSKVSLIPRNIANCLT